MTGKLVTTDLNLQGIRRVRNIATPLHQLDAIRKIDLDTAIATINTVVEGAANGVSRSEMQAAINASVTGAVRLLGEADASASNAIAATNSDPSRVFVPGDAYKVSAAGETAFGLPLAVGDLVVFTPSGWLRFEGGVTPSVVAGTGITVAVAGETYTVSLAPEILAQLQSLTQQAAQALADAQAARQLAESHAAPLSALQAFQASASQAVADMLATQQGHGTQLAAQATLVQTLEAFRTLTVTQLQAVSFKFVEGVMTHAQGQAIATPPVPDAGFSPVPGLPGFEMAIDSGADNGGTFLIIKHPKTGMPKFSVLAIDGDGNGDVIADQGHYLDDAIGVPTNEAWVAMPAYGSYAVIFV